MGCLVVTQAFEDSECQQGKLPASLYLMTLIASASNALYLFFGGELCAVKHSAVLGIVFQCTHSVFYVRVDKVEEVHVDLVISLQITQEKWVFFRKQLHKKRAMAFLTRSVGRFIHIDNGKKAMQYLCVGIESLVKMWCDVIREWMKLIQKENHQNTLSNRALNRVLFLHSLL